jgi:hypothetical protein
MSGELLSEGMATHFATIALAHVDGECAKKREQELNGQADVRSPRLQQRVV